MDYADRQKRIVEHLRIKSTSHGQIYTFQMAVSPSTPTNIPLERFEAIKHSLTQQGTNLIPLIIRRTEAYSEEEEYEVIYGVDWYLVAKEIGIEKLWVWVFNMTDEEAQIASQEMELLAGKSEANVPVAVLPDSIKPDSDKQIELLVKQFEKLLAEQYSSMVRKIELSLGKLQESTTHALENKLSELFLQDKSAEYLVDKLGELFSKVDKIEAAMENRPLVKLEPVVNLSSYSKDELNSMSISILKPIAKGRGLKGYSNWRKDKLIDAIINAGE